MTGKLCEEHLYLPADDPFAAATLRCTEDLGHDTGPEPTPHACEPDGAHNIDMEPKRVRISWSELAT